MNKKVYTVGIQEYNNGQLFKTDVLVFDSKEAGLEFMDKERDLHKHGRFFRDESPSYDREYREYSYFGRREILAGQWREIRTDGK